MAVYTEVSVKEAAPDAQHMSGQARGQLDDRATQWHPELLKQNHPPLVGQSNDDYAAPGADALGVFPPAISDQAQKAAGA